MSCPAWIYRRVDKFRDTELKGILAGLVYSRLGRVL